MLSDQSSSVYDWAEHVAFQTELIGAAKPVEYYFLYPPHFLFATPAFAWLEPVQAYLAFLAGTIVLYATALNLIARDWLKALPAAIAGGGAYICMLWVQNGFLTAALLVSGLVFLPARPALSGVLFGILTVKPQLGLLVPIALAAGGYWRTFAWAAGTFLALALVTELFLGPGIWLAFLASMMQTKNFLEAGSLWFKMQTPFALTLPILGQIGAYAIQGIVAAFVGWLVWRTWREPRTSYWLKSALLIPASLLVSPYLYAYDAVPLTAAALLLLRDNPNLPMPDCIALFAACVVAGLTAYLLSAAVPIAAAVIILLILRQIERSSKSNGNPKSHFEKLGHGLSRAPALLVRSMVKNEPVRAGRKNSGKGLTEAPE